MSAAIFLKDRELLDVTPVENVFITRFMPSAPEYAVKVYLYGLMLVCSVRSGGEDIACALGMEQEDIRSAFCYWESVGIVKVLGDDPLKVMYLNIREALENGGADTAGAAYGEFVKRISEAAGTRMITGSELKKMYDWLDVYGFEQDAAVEIFKRCLDEKGARTSVSYMDAVAGTLAGKGFLTRDAVAAHFDDEKLLKSGAAGIIRKWHQRRPPTEAELALYEKWTRAWGFDEPAIDAALLQMTAAEKPSFAYLDSILTSWHEGGVVDGERVKEQLHREDMTVELARQVFARAGLVSKPTAEQRRLIGDWHYAKHMSAELILFAAELSKDDARPFYQLKRIVSDWYEHGLSTVPEAAKYHETNSGYRSPRTKKKSGAMNYMQGEVYSRDDLKKMGISLGEEFYKDDEE